MLARHKPCNHHNVDKIHHPNKGSHNVGFHQKRGFIEWIVPREVHFQLKWASPRYHQREEQSSHNARQLLDVIHGILYSKIEDNTTNTNFTSCVWWSRTTKQEVYIMNGFFANGGTNCGCGNDYILILLLVCCCGCNICDILPWLLIMNCCGNGIGCCK